MSSSFWLLANESHLCAAFLSSGHVWLKEKLESTSKRWRRPHSDWFCIQKVGVHLRVSVWCVCMQISTRWCFPAVLPSVATLYAFFFVWNYHTKEFIICMDICLYFPGLNIFMHSVFLWKYVLISLGFIWINKVVHHVFPYKSQMHILHVWVRCALASALMFSALCPPQFSKEKYLLESPPEKLRKELEEELKLSPADIRSHGWYHGHIPQEVRTPEHTDLFCWKEYSDL